MHKDVISYCSSVDSRVWFEGPVGCGGVSEDSPPLRLRLGIGLHLEGVCNGRPGRPAGEWILTSHEVSK